LKSTLEKKFAKMFDELKKPLEWISKKFKGIKNYIKDKSGKIVDKVSDLAEKGKNYIKDKSGKLIEKTSKQKKVKIMLKKLLMMV